MKYDSELALRIAKAGAAFAADLERLLELKPTVDERRFGITVAPKLPKVREQPWYRKGQRW